MLPAKTNGRFRSLAATTILLACLAAASGPLGAQSPEKSSPVEPEVGSVYPLGARPGDSLRAEVLGQDLDGCYALWFSHEGLSASIQGVETLESEQPRDYAAGCPNRSVPGSGFPSNWRWLPKPDRESIGCAW